MSFVKNSYSQMTLNDSTLGLTAREKKFLDKSWATYFADYVFPNIDENLFAVLYSDNPASRPNTPVNVLFAANILEQDFGQNDDEILESLMFDVRYQVALHTTSFEEQPLSDKSLQRFRRKLLEYEEETGIDLTHECMKKLSAQMAGFLKLTGKIKRMDSMMIASNIRNMSRLELLYTCVANMVHRIHECGDDALISGMEHYLESNDRNRVIYHNKDDSSEIKTAAVLRDAGKLLSSIPESYTETSEWILLKRVISEQTVEENGVLRLKTKEEGLSGVMQNPADPEATFRRKAGENNIGYSANLVEDVNVDEDGKVTGSLITDYDLQKNTYSDSQFMKDEIAAMGKQDEPVTVITDAAFSSQENEELAAQNNINHIPTDLMGKDVNPFLAEFKMNEEGTKVLECPNGCTPKSCSYNKNTGMCRTSFYSSQCASCPHKDQCHPKIYKRTAVHMISKGMIVRANKQKTMKTDEYKKYGRIRNGVETVPSMLRRFCDADKMPVRGLLRMRQRLGFMIGAVNFRKFKRQQQRVKSAQLMVSAANA